MQTARTSLWMITAWLAGYILTMWRIKLDFFNRSAILVAYREQTSESVIWAHCLYREELCFRFLSSKLKKNKQQLHLRVETSQTTMEKLENESTVHVHWTGWLRGITVEVQAGDQVHIWAKALLWLQPWKQISGSLLPCAAGAAAPEQSGCEPTEN